MILYKKITRHKGNYQQSMKTCSLYPHTCVVCFRCACSVLHCVLFVHVMFSAFWCRHVEASDLLVTGKYIFNHYRDLQDINYYYSTDEVLRSLPVNVTT